MGTAPSAGMEMDIIVEKTCTVKEVQKLPFMKHYLLMLHVRVQILSLDICSVSRKCWMLFDLMVKLHQRMMLF